MQKPLQGTSRTPTLLLSEIGNAICFRSAGSLDGTCRCHDGSEWTWMDSPSPDVESETQLLCVSPSCTKEWHHVWCHVLWSWKLPLGQMHLRLRCQPWARWTMGRFLVPGKTIPTETSWGGDRCDRSTEAHLFLAQMHGWVDRCGMVFPAFKAFAFLFYGNSSENLISVVSSDATGEGVKSGDLNVDGGIVALVSPLSMGTELDDHPDNISQDELVVRLRKDDGALVKGIETSFHAKSRQLLLFKCSTSQFMQTAGACACEVHEICRCHTGGTCAGISQVKCQAVELTGYKYGTNNEIILWNLCVWHNESYTIPPSCICCWELLRGVLFVRSFPRFLID